MDEKKLDQVENLEDEQLEGVNGGTRIFSTRSRVTVIDADDGVRVQTCLTPAEEPVLGAATRCRANGDEELDGRNVGGIPHIPSVYPKPRN